MSREEKIQRQENANIDAMMRIHKRIDEVVEDPKQRTLNLVHADV